MSSRSFRGSVAWHPERRLRRRLTEQTRVRKKILRARVKDLAITGLVVTVVNDISFIAIHFRLMILYVEYTGFWRRNTSNLVFSSLLPFASRAPALENTNTIIWCVTLARCLRTDRTSGLLSNLVLDCERDCETVLTILEHQCASANIVDNSLKTYIEMYLSTGNILYR